VILKENLFISQIRKSSPVPLRVPIFG
jgi:hypothetical protein